MPSADCVRRIVDTKTKLPGGKAIEGIQGLRDYLTAKTAAMTSCGSFAASCSAIPWAVKIQLSDEPLIETMIAQLPGNDYRFSVAVEMIVSSRQFREIRGRKNTED